MRDSGLGQSHLPPLPTGERAGVRGGLASAAGKQANSLLRIPNPESPIPDSDKNPDQKSATCSSAASPSDTAPSPTLTMPVMLIAASSSVTPVSAQAVRRPS